MNTFCRSLAALAALAIATTALTPSQGADLAIRERQADGITILDLKGKLTGEGATALRQAVLRLLGKGQTKIVLNFKNVGDFDRDAAFGELIAVHKAVRAKEGQLKFCEFSTSLKEELAIDKLLLVFDVFDNENEALETFQP
ncbi:MAG: anti-sigma factor antagonist [Verrucomicrobiota bacterium]|jgi:anti-sigma B factor antagonist